MLGASGSGSCMRLRQPEPHSSRDDRDSRDHCQCGLDGETALKRAQPGRECRRDGRNGLDSKNR